MATGDDRSRCHRRTRPACSTLPPVQPASPSIWPTAPMPGSPASTSARTCWAEADATSRRRPTEPYRARPWSRRAICRSRTRPSMPYVHLPPALRRRPGGHHRRAGPRGAPRRGVGQPRVRRAPQPLLAGLVVALHPRGAPRGRRVCSAGGRGSTSVASSVPTSPRTTRASRSPPTSPRGRGAGLTDVGVRRMSLGGGLVMWGRRAADDVDAGSERAVNGPGAPRSPRPSTRARPRPTAVGVGRLVGAAPPALHAVAPLLRRHRRDLAPDSTAAGWSPPCSRSSSPSVCAPTASTSCTTARCARQIPAWLLVAAAAASLAGAVALGVVGLPASGPGSSCSSSPGSSSRAGTTWSCSAAACTTTSRSPRRGVPSRSLTGLLRPSRDAATARPRRGRGGLLAVGGATLAQHPGPHAAPKGGVSRWDGHAERRQPTADRRALAAHTAGAGAARHGVEHGGSGGGAGARSHLTGRMAVVITPRRHASSCGPAGA